MKDTVKEYLDRKKKRASRQKKVVATLLSLSLVVATGVTWSLHQTGESLTGQTYCGKTEHTHTEACLKKTDSEENKTTEKVLTCTKPEHTHTDACIQKTLICGQEESSGHTHSVEAGCYQEQQILTCTQAEHTHSAEAGCYDEEGNLICTTPEHTHGEGCYTTEQVLVCTQPESTGHVHTDACYEITYNCGMEEHTHTDECYSEADVTVEGEEASSAGTAADGTTSDDITDGTSETTEPEYICGLEEHKHTLQCYSNPNADLETAAVWEQTFAGVTLTGDYGKDVVAIAKTQLGYHESTENYNVVKDDDGTEKMKGYTRYGAWYNSPYEDWCAMFVSFCINYAHVQLPDDTAYPLDASCENWIITLSQKNLYSTKDSWTPVIGSLVFFDEDHDGTSDHVGIVSGLTQNGNELSEDADYSAADGIKTIEGNSSDMVAERTYALTDSTIVGYGLMPKMMQTAEGDGYTVKVTYDGSAKLPSNAKLSVKAVEDDSESDQEKLTQALGSDTASSICTLDISFIADGQEVEPAEGSTVEVQITLPEVQTVEEGQALGVVHYKDDGTTEAMSDVSTGDSQSAGQTLTFTTDSFSKYKVSLYSASRAASGTIDGVAVETSTKYVAWLATPSGSTNAENARLFLESSSSGGSVIQPVYCFNHGRQYPRSSGNRYSEENDGSASPYVSDKYKSNYSNSTSPYYKASNVSNDSFKSAADGETLDDNFQSTIYSVIWNGYPYNASGLLDAAEQTYSSAGFTSKYQMLYRATQLAIWYYTDGYDYSGEAGAELADQIVAAAEKNPAPDGFSMDLYLTEEEIYNDETHSNEKAQHLLTVSYNPDSYTSVKINKVWAKGEVATDTEFEIYNGQSAEGTPIGTLTIKAGEESGTATFSSSEVETYVTLKEKDASPSNITSTQEGASANVENGTITLIAANGDKLSDYVTQVEATYTNPSSGGTVDPGTGGGTKANDVKPSQQKYIKDNKDGTYDLTLNVTGSTATESNKEKVDIVFVVDTSGSMDSSNNDAGENRLKSVTDGIKTLVNGLDANTSEVDARYNLVTFSSEATIRTSSWVTGTEVENMLPTSATGGTNYQDALVKAGTAASSTKLNGRSDAKTVVLFLTDGVPQGCLMTQSNSREYDAKSDYSNNYNTKYYKLSNDGSVEFIQQYYYSGTYYSGWTTATDALGYINPNYTWGDPYTGRSGSKFRDCNQLYYNGALMGARTVNCDAFYAVGFGSEVDKAGTNVTNQIPSGISPRTPLQLLTNVANETTASIKEAKVVSNNGLSEFFDEFKASLTKINISNVTITDTLSQYAQVTGDDAKVTIKVTDKDGNEKGSAAGTIGSLPTLNLTDDGGTYAITAQYDSEKKILTLDFPDEYTLHQDWTYAITVQIEPTQKAYDEYAKSNYPHTGDNNTDAPDNVPNTSSGKAGFYSNSTATLTYTVTGESPKTTDYDKPVIQVSPVLNLTVQKTKMDGGTKLTGAEFALYKYDTDKTTKLYYSIDASGSVSWVAEKDKQNLPNVKNGDATDESQFYASKLPDGTYYLEETVTPQGYKSLDGVITITVTGGKVVSAAKGTGSSNEISFEQSKTSTTDYTVTVPNSTGYELPETGGTGTTMFTLSGLCLMAGTFVYGCGLRRRRERRIR